MKMTKIKVTKRMESDVTEMFANGWRVSVFRHDDFRYDFLVISKDRIRFEIRPDKETHCIIVSRFVDGKKVDYKKFYDTGLGVTGTVCILEDTMDNTYCFFRTEDLQQLIDTYRLKKVLFAKQAGEKFTYTMMYNPELHKNSFAPIHTDGTMTNKMIEGKDSIEIVDATYVYDASQSILVIPQVYNPETIHALMKEIIG